MPSLPNDQSDNETTAEQIERLIEDVTRYLGWHEAITLATAYSATTAEAAASGKPTAGMTIDDFAEMYKFKGDAEARICENGPALAEALESYGFDSAGLLSIVHCAGAGGGGLDHVRPEWEQNKVALQRAALQLRQSDREPLTPDAVLVYEALCDLPEHKAMKGPQILQMLAEQNRFIDQSTLTKNIIPELRRWGVANRPRVGYYIKNKLANSH